MNVEIERRFHEGLPVLENVLRFLGRRLAHVVPFEDLRANAHTALLEAARTYDPSRASLSTYVSRKIRWALLDGVKRERRSRRALARASAMLASERLAEDHGQTPDEPGIHVEEHEAKLDRLLEAHSAALAIGLLTGAGHLPSDDDTPEERACKAELSRVVRSALAELPERERELVHRHYFGGEDFDEIAKDLGISKSWASRVHAQAIQNLAKIITSRHDPAP